MKEKRKPEFSCSLKIGGKKAVKILFFASAQWEDSPENCFRIMVGGAWWGGTGQEKKFFTRMACARMLFDIALGAEHPPQAPQGIIAGTRISVPTGRRLPCGTPEYYGSFAFSKPMLAFDGRYYVATSIFGKGGCMVCIEDIVVHAKRGRK